MATRRWSGAVTRSSNALDLERDVFTLDDPAAIARSLRRSALASTRRKTDAFRSAMSMLTFYINRAGTNLPKKRRATLEKAKTALRHEFKRPAFKRPATSPRRRAHGGKKPRRDRQKA